MELVKALEHRGPSLVHCLMPPPSLLTNTTNLPKGPVSTLGNPGTDLTCVSKTRIPAAVSHTPSLPTTSLHQLRENFIFANISKFFLILLFVWLSGTPGAAHSLHLLPRERCPVLGKRPGLEGTRVSGGHWVPCPLHR